MLSPALKAKCKTPAPTTKVIVLPSRVPQQGEVPLIHVDIQTGQVLVNRLADVLGPVFAKYSEEVR